MRPYGTHLPYPTGGRVQDPPLRQASPPAKAYAIRPYGTFSSRPTLNAFARNSPMVE